MRKCVFFFALLVCGCDFGVSGIDGGGGDMAAPGAPVAKITATPDVVGFATKLSALESSDAAGRTLTYMWHITATPSGSTITDAALSSATDAQPTFEPDLGGDYTLELTVSAGDDSSTA